MVEHRDLAAWCDAVADKQTETVGQQPVALHPQVVVTAQPDQPRSMRSETGRSGVSRRSGRDRGVNGVRRMSIFVRLMPAQWQSITSLVIPVIRYSFGKVARLVSDRGLFRVMGNESLTETQKARVLDRAIDSLRRAFPTEWGIAHRGQ